MADDEDKPTVEEAIKAYEEVLAEAALNDNDGLPKEGEEINAESAALQHQRDLDRETARFKANALDRASTSLVTIGVFTPMVGVLYHSTIVAFMQTEELAAAVVSCLIGAFVLHWVGRGILETGYSQ